MTVTLRAGQTTEDPRLDWLPPPDDRHRELYPMLAPSRVWDAPAPVPVVLGIPWYEAFYADQLIERKDRFGRPEWWIREGDLGREVGGHAIACEPNTPKRRDTTEWWQFYDQGMEGACVGFAWSRCMSLLNRTRYAARPFYLEVQRGDPWPGGAYEGADPFYEGTSTRHGGDVLRTRGHMRQRGQRVGAWDAGQGIEAVRWATSVEQVMAALGRSGEGGPVLLNSWGRRGYPHRVRMPESVLHRVVVVERGEAAIPTDR
jgi:hypothetical protein